MLKRNLTVASIAVISLFITGCNSTPETNAAELGMNIPQWVLNPTSENGLAAASCVTASNNLSLSVCISSPVITPCLTNYSS